jgi:hypothetical protein
MAEALSAQRGSPRYIVSNYYALAVDLRSAGPGPTMIGEGKAFHSQAIFIVLFILFYYY